MNQLPTHYKIRFLVATKSWEQVKKVFRDDLEITKDKKDDSVVPIRDHFVVEVELSESDLTDNFYQKVVSSKCITILSDEFSQKNARQMLEMIVSVELKLRELAVYAYDLAATYKQIMNTKHKDAKQLLTNNQLVGENVSDPLISFLDFGELIDFLGRTGNQVDESNLADDTARLIESSASFDEFKKKYTQKFKKLTVWEIISDAILETKTEWSTIKHDLEKLKDTRNTALHHRVLTPAKTAEAKVITKRLARQFTTKAPKKNSFENMDAVFESWNTALKGYNSYQKIFDNLAAIDTSALQRIIEQRFDSQKILQHTLANAIKFPETSFSAFGSLSKSLDTINKLGLSSWVADNENEANPKHIDLERNDENKDNQEDRNGDEK